MAPKTRSGGAGTSRGGPSSSKPKRARQDPTPPRRRGTRRAGSSTMSTDEVPEVPPLPWVFRNDGHKKEYERLASRGFICTRYIDDTALEQLEIKEELYRLLEGFGWSRLSSLRFSTYRELTLEFLSSLHFDIQTFSPIHEGRITFRLLGEERVHTLASFNSMFGCPLDGIRSIEDTTFSVSKAWEAFTDLDIFTGPYDARSSKASKLRSPVLRYIHRFLAHSIFARGESTGVVRRDELFFLWAMTNGIQLNTAVWMCSHFYHVRGGTGKIGVGGLVSAIADFYGFMPMPDLCTRVRGNESIDLETLSMMGICRKEKGQYFLLNEAGEIIPKRQAGGSGTYGTQHTSSSRETGTPPQVSVRATASTPGATVSAAAYTHPTMPEVGAATLDMLMARMERMETRMMQRFDRLESRVDTLEKKLDEARESD